MKKAIYLIPVVAGIFACSTPSNQSTAPETADTVEVVEVIEEQVYPYFAGTAFAKDSAMSADEFAQMVAEFDGKSTQVMFSSNIIDNCAKKGCWMHVAAGDEKVRVSFKDYEFFVPLDAAGHSTTLNGTLYYDTLTVEQLRHYAMDANASEDSIAGITEPIITLSYEATGVYVD